MATLESTQAVIEELGGIRAVADLVGAKATTIVHNWRARGRFPATSYRVIKSALAAKGLDADEALWPEMIPSPASETAEAQR